MMVSWRVQWVGRCITTILVQRKSTVNIYIIALAEGASHLFIYLLNISNDNQRCQCNAIYRLLPAAAVVNTTYMVDISRQSRSFFKSCVEILKNTYVP